jgi:uncharacterized membrane protein
MEIEFIKIFLLYNLVIHFTIMLIWLVMIGFASPIAHQFHSRFFPMSKEVFDKYHYLMLGFYKLAILLLIAVPYLVLTIIT